MNTDLKIDKRLFGKGLSPLELLILAYVVQNGDEASNNQIGKYFSVTGQTASRALKRLENLQLLTTKCYVDKITGTHRSILVNQQNLDAFLNG